MVAQPKRPILRYHGGKWKLAPWIIGHFPKHKVYVEPFGGGASVLLRKPRAYAEVYNDLDGEIVNLFQIVRDRGEELRGLVELTPFARDEFEGAYTPSDDPLEQARRTLVKSFMGFGSAAVTQAASTSPGAGFKATTGFRSNSNRSGTTPAHDWKNWPARMSELIERLQGVVIENRDAIECMRQHDEPHTLHYVDPPYVHDTRALKQHRTPQSYRHEMTDTQHAQLVESLKGLRGMVVVSLYEHPIYDALDWQKVMKATHADGARERTECLYLSPSATITPSLFTEDKSK